MPAVFLGSGSMVLIDDEDAALIEGVSWHIYRIRPSMKPAVARNQTRFRRMFRLYMHREVAARMRPEIVMKKFRAMPINGDYLDCRRENINVVLAKGRQGRHSKEPRPSGWERNPLKRPRRGLPPPSSLWAGGLVWRQVNKRKSGGKTTFRLCEGRHPID